MMSVKHISLSGEETLHVAKSVRYSPAVDNSNTGSPATLWITNSDLDDAPLTGGTCFVMNDQGRTIARYDLGASMVPAARKRS